jgi:putative tryptophan/tyrosine transport system substrate-binding protein
MKRAALGLIVSLALGLLVAPLFAKVQRPGGIPRIGVLGPISANDSTTEAFRQGLRDLGYVEGQNIRIE